MTYARKSLVSLEDTPYYHVIARCVRRAFLCGVDEYAGRDYSHRKQWVLERLNQLTSIFCIEVCAYAVMSNHYHLVLYVDRAAAERLSQHEVAERWTQLYCEPTIVARWRNGTATAAERLVATKLIERWRHRLYDISWFMKALNEYLARRANVEDECTGHFWQGRFKSQALLDEAGVLTAMAYVDLNPIRAGTAATPEESTFTSIYQRIQAIAAERSKKDGELSVPLRAFRTSARKAKDSIPFRLEDYIELVDWTGRSIYPGKRGAMDARLPPILKRLNVDPVAWRVMMQREGNKFGRAMGPLDHLRLHANTLGQSWVRGLRGAEKLYAC